LENQLYAVRVVTLGDMESGEGTVLLNLGPLFAMKHLKNSLSVLGIDFLESAG